MKENNLKGVLIAIFLGVSSVIFSQNVAINTSGNSAYVSAILDLSNNNTPGTVGLLPPYVTFTLPLTNFQLAGVAAQSNGIIVYNTGGLNPAGLYYWNNTGSTWVQLGGAGAIGGAGTLNYLARWTPNGTTLGIGVTQDNGVSVAINTTATPPVASQMLTVMGNATAVNAIIGTTAQSGGTGVEGSVINSGGSGGYGVQGLISGSGGGFQYGVYGASTVTGGNGYGVYGAATGVGAAINYGGYFSASGGTNNYGVVVPAGGGNSGFGTNAPVSNLDDAGSFGIGTFNFTTGVGGGSYSLTALANACTYIATPPPVAQTYTLTLPSPVANPRQIYTVVYYGTGLGTIDLVPAANTIYQNGVSINPLPITGGSITVQSDGTNYQVLSSNAVAAANNGLSTGGTNAQLGGSNLIKNSNIPLNGFSLSVAGTGETTTFVSTGQVGIGNAVPAASAVLDLTNSINNLGFLMPGMTTPQRNAIALPASGLEIFNTTTGCINYWTGFAWENVACPTCVGPPATPGAIAGDLTPSSNTNNNIYSVATVPGAIAYYWSVLPYSAGTVVTGQGTNTISINFGPAGIPYTICVHDSNACGISANNCVTATASNCVHSSQTFNYTGSVQTWITPACVSQVTVQLWGAGGGSGYMNTVTNVSGGSGAYITGVITGLTGQTLTITVPGGGGYSTVAAGGAGGWPNGGIGGSDASFLEFGGGGGGSAAIQIGATYYAVAGGGAGGGSGEYGGAGYGGEGGATTGGVGGSPLGSNAFGGSIFAGGVAGGSGNVCDPGLAGNLNIGGNGGGGVCSGEFGGGGGGGGYYGGGGGGDYGGGGGGGSSYPAASIAGVPGFTLVNNIQGNNNTSDGTALAPGSPNPVTMGAGNYAAPGGNGVIIITW